MFEILTYVLIALAIAVVAILCMAMTKPATFSAARSIRIGASPDQLYPLIDDLRAMNTWNPYALRETTGTGSYSGPARGEGAAYAFSGPKSGTGTIEITGSRPDQVQMRLRMTAPMAIDNQVVFSLAPAGAATDVTWAMTGPAGFMGRIFSVFMDCETMMARDFDEGLANLKAIAEKR